MRRTLASIVAVLGLGTAMLTGCSSGHGGATAGPKLTVVTPTNVWGAVAAAVAGDHATVTALDTKAGADPHEFEPSAADTAKVADASVVVVNGGHYDDYLENAAKKSKAIRINAFDLRNNPSDNPHVFYDLGTVGRVATAVGEALAAKDPAGAAAFRANARTFNARLVGLANKLTAIKVAHNGTPVAESEPLAGYLLAQAGLVDATPPAFTKTVEEGQAPSAADRAATEDLVNRHGVEALVYNTQAVDPVTEALITDAGTAKVPVLKFTETLPDGVGDYIAWQSHQIEELRAALDSHGNH